MAQIMNAYSSIEQVHNQFLAGTSKPNVQTSSALDFHEILKQEAVKHNTTHSLTFSKHANQRLASRNISLSTEQVQRLHEGVERAREKGIQESLVMLDNLSFIVNIKNDTVVTALDSQSGEQQIFTNIDGAVIA